MFDFRYSKQRNDFIELLMKLMNNDKQIAFTEPSFQSSSEKKICVSTV